MLTFPERKQIRAGIIAEYVREAGYPGVVVFSCGNAAETLRGAGLDVLEIGPQGSLQPGKWWTPAEIRKAWPHLFDATSGHLPIPLMVSIAGAFRAYLGHLPELRYGVPTGSGETIVCLRWAYPGITFEPVYNISRGTQYEPLAPLNKVVQGDGWQ